MVKILIATLLVGIAVWLYLRSTNAAGSAPVSLGGGDVDLANATPEGGSFTGNNGAVYTKLNGNIYLTQPSQAMIDAAAAGATAYDQNNPDVAQRRLDALARGTTEAQIAASQGTTVDDLYQQHLRQSLADQQKETAVIMAVGGSGGSTASPPPPSPTPPLGTQPTSTPPVPGVSTGPTVESRRGIGHFGGSTPTVAAGTDPNTAAYVNAVLNAGPKSPPPQPGMTWSYTDQQWEWALA